MALNYNIDEVLEEFRKTGGTTKFPDSLKQVLSFIKKDDNITSIQQAAYLLATAKAESDYSLQRWEADYVCGRCRNSLQRKTMSKSH